MMMLLFIVGCDKEDPHVTAILLDTTSVELKEGETHQFKVTHTPPEAPAPAYEWHVAADYSPVIDDTYYFGEISQSGLFKATGVGTTYVTVRTTNVVDPQTGKPFSQTCTVKINPIEVETLKLDRNEVTMAVGDTVHIHCSVLPENATYKTVQWTTSNREVVMLSTLQEQLCILTANGVGEATVKAYSRDGKQVVSCKVTVTPGAVKEIQFDVKEHKMEVGQTKQLEVTYKPEVVRDKSLKWASSNEKVATVDQNGLITAKAKGQTTITATAVDGNCTAKCEVSVVDFIDLIEVHYSTQGAVIINGILVNTTVSSWVTNNSAHTIRLIKYRIVNSSTGITVAETTDTSLIGGDIKPGESSASLKATVNNVFLPYFIWTFEYEGKEYEVKTQYKLF